MLDILYAAVFLLFISVGLKVPQVSLMGYIWIDMIGPQSISYGFLKGKPLSMIMVLVFFLSAFLNLKSLSKPKSFIIPAVIVAFASWITLTSFSALYPDLAWIKWDWAFKVVMFTLFIALVLDSKLHCELLILVIVFSFSFYTLSVGVKTFFGGGGYGSQLLFSAGNSGFQETSTMSAVAVICISLKLFLMKYSEILPKHKYTTVMLWLLIVADILTVVGTQARTGLIALSCLALFQFIRSKRKFSYVVVCFALALIAFFVAPESWFSRMDTINDYESDSSSAGRIAVWKWTIKFVEKHPFGGGFGTYRANVGELIIGPNGATNNTPKAFHSVVFEVLGEHGYIGLLLYVLILFLSIYKLFGIMKKNKKMMDEWVTEISATVIICIILYVVSGLFIGIAFQPLIYYLIALVLVIEKISYKTYDRDTYSPQLGQ